MTASHQRRPLPPRVQLLDEVVQARKVGISWMDMLEALPELAVPDPALAPWSVCDPRQARTAREYISFRSGMLAEDDPETAERGARILMAARDATETTRKWGLLPGGTDFSDLGRTLREWAYLIHRRHGKHEGNGQPDPGGAVA